MKPDTNPFDLYDCPNPYHFHELGKRLAFGYQVAREYWAQPGPDGTVAHLYIQFKRVFSKTYPNRVQYTLTLGRLALTMAWLKKPAKMHEQ